MSPSLLLALGLLLAVLIGWAVNEGGICAVAATREVVGGRPPRLLAGSLLASAVAGMLLLPAAWIAGPAVHLVGSGAIDETLIVGAILLGVGAIVNDACLLGALARLGDGELRFLALPIGIAAGSALAGPTRAIGRPSFDTAAWANTALAAAFAVAAIVAGRYLARGDVRLPGRRWPLAWAMLVLGVAGGALYAFAPGWTWSDAIRRNLPYAMAMGDGGAGTALAAATVVGSMAAAVRDRRFRPVLPTSGGAVRSFVGGAVMAVGAVRVPGGNDSLLLAAIPSGSASGALAYVVMAAMVAVILVARRLLSL